MDALLILALLLAAWAFVAAAQRGSLRWLLLGAAVLGLGFNIKMMQAFLVLPAFYLLCLLAARARWRMVATVAVPAIAQNAAKAATKVANKAARQAKSRRREAAKAGDTQKTLSSGGGMPAGNIALLGAGALLVGGGILLYKKSPIS